MNDFPHWDLLALFLIGLIGSIVSFFGIKRQGDVRPAPVPGPSPVQQQADKDSQAAVQQAQEKRDQQVAQATQQHDQAVSAQAKDLREKTEEARDDVDKTNAVLQDISKQMQ